MAKESIADKALKRSQARGEIRKMLTETQSSGQVKIARERGRQRRSVEKAKAQQRIIERQGSETARTQAYADRAKIAQEQRAAASQLRVETQGELAGLQRREKVISGVSGTVTRSSIWSTITLITAIFFGMIIIYVIVTRGEQFGALTGGIGTFIQGLSSNEPLFVASSPDEET